MFHYFSNHNETGYYSSSSIYFPILVFRTIINFDKITLILGLKTHLIKFLKFSINHFVVKTPKSCRILIFSGYSYMKLNAVEFDAMELDQKRKAFSRRHLISGGSG